MKRYAGVLLSVTSLPSQYGIGCFSKSAYDFVDWLAKAGQRYWQILPLGATSYGGSDDSPYQAFSAFAGNPYFISLETLIEEGVLTEEECDAMAFGEDAACIDYRLLHENRYQLLHTAYERSDISHNAEYQQFVAENAWWLDDYALFMAVKNFFGEKAWTEWPEDIRMHWGFALDYYREKLYFDIEFQKYMQFQFYRQWRALKAYANEKHIEIVGDIPIYVSPDSADVWSHPELFQLDEQNRPLQVAGCPPDGFSEDGQLWGNPLYRWDYHRNTDYAWWMSRMWYSYQLYDVVRIDHFRGFDEYYCIPTGSSSAKNGHWEKGPGMDFFNRMKEHLGEKSVIAEDLGYITKTVRQLVKDSGFPNMKVLQFAFDAEDEAGTNDYLPHNYNENCVVYTGTHDNDTMAGWFKAADKETKKMVREYLCNPDTADKRMYRVFVAAAMRSCAGTCIIPIQDHLGLGNECRMNQPATVGKNWRWRLLPGQVTAELAEEVLIMTKRYGRANWEALQKAEETEEIAETIAIAETAEIEETKEIAVTEEISETKEAKEIKETKNR